LVDEVRKSGAGLAAGEVQVCLRLVTELARKRFRDAQVARGEGIGPAWSVDDAIVGSAKAARFLNVPAARWGRVTSWSGLIGGVPAGGAVIVVFEQPGDLGHALALVDTTNGTYVVDPHTGRDVRVYRAPERWNADRLSGGMPALVNARALRLNHDGTVAEPIAASPRQPGSITEALTDPADPRVGAGQVRRTAPSENESVARPTAVGRALADASPDMSAEDRTTGQVEEPTSQQQEEVHVLGENVGIETIRRVLEKLPEARYQELIGAVRNDLNYGLFSLPDGVLGEGAPLTDLPAGMHDDILRAAYKKLVAEREQAPAGAQTPSTAPDAEPVTDASGAGPGQAELDPVAQARERWRRLVDDHKPTSYADDPKRAAAAAERVAERLRRGEPPLKLSPRPSGQGPADGREFGMEVEVGFQDTADWESTIASLSRELQQAGFMRGDGIGLHHESHNAGYTRNRGDWRMEREHIDWKAELISPILRDEQQTWDDLTRLLTIAIQRGGTGHPNKAEDGTIGGHVHVSTGDYGNDATAYHTLLNLYRAFEDVLFRLATNPRTGKHRGTAMTYPARAFRISTEASIEDMYNASAHPLALSFGAVEGKKSDHVEWRLWDGSVDPAEWQIRVRLSVAMVEAALRLSRQPDAVEHWGDEALGSHAHTQQQILHTSTYQGDTVNVYRLDSPQEIKSVLRLVDLVFTRDEDKDQVLELFALTTWAKDTSAWPVPQDVPELSWIRPATSLVMTRSPEGIAFNERPSNTPDFARDALRGKSTFTVWTEHDQDGDPFVFSPDYAVFKYPGPRALADLVRHAGWVPGQALLLSANANFNPVGAPMLQRAAYMGEILATTVYVPAIPQRLAAYDAELLRWFQIFADPATPPRVDSTGVALPQSLLRYTPASLKPEPGPLGKLVETPIDLTQMLDAGEVVETVGHARARRARTEPGPSYSAKETDEASAILPPEPYPRLGLHRITWPTPVVPPAPGDPTYFNDLAGHVKTILNRQQQTTTDRSDGWLETAVRDYYGLLEGVQRRNPINTVAAYIVDKLADQGLLQSRPTEPKTDALAKIDWIESSYSTPGPDGEKACVQAAIIESGLPT
jgi:hypothetical protein